MNIIRDENQCVSYIKVDGIFVPVEHYTRPAGVRNTLISACALALIVAGIYAFLLMM